MDYDLTRLGPLQFERMVQALALAEFGADVQIFGRGPDGGREASFSHLDYRDQHSQRPWNGYGVMQAKFVDDSVGPQTEGAATFLKACRREVANWQSRSKGTRRPKYILFATNVVLSGGADKGAIDKFYSYVGAAAVEFGLPLKGWDVWHYAKICALLDIHEGVRRAYFALIAPGDFLTAAMQYFVGDDQLTAQAMRANLLSTLNEEETMRLGELGSSEQSSVSLSNLFFDLPCRDDDRDVETSSVMTKVLDSFDRITRPSDPASAPARIVVVGGPGQGKTTIGRYLAQMYRAELLRGIDGLDRLATESLRSIDSARSRLAIKAPVNRRWPVRVVLSEFANSLKAGGEDLSLSKFIVDEFNRYGEVKLSAARFASWLNSYPVALVLDGMDEVPVDLRADVNAQISRFTDSALAGNADLAVLITTRPQGGDRTDFSPQTYDHWFLVPLSPTIAAAYARHLAQLRFGTVGKAFSDLTGRIEEALDSVNTQRLMSTPLQVAIMTLLLERRTRIPESRFGLFDEYFTTIYAREEAKPGYQGAMLQKHRPLIEGVIERAALVLHLRSESARDQAAWISSQEFEQIIHAVVEDAGAENRLTDNIFRAVVDRLVLLVSDDEGRWHIETRSLQEYLVARAWTAGELNVQQTRALLEASAASTFWRNVWLFSAGRIFNDLKLLRDTIQALVLGLDQIDGLSRRIYPSAALAADLLLDRSLAPYPRYERSIIAVAMNLGKMGTDSELRSLVSSLDVLQIEKDAFSMIRDSVTAFRAQNSATDCVHLLRHLGTARGKLRQVAHQHGQLPSADTSRRPTQDPREVHKALSAFKLRLSPSERLTMNSLLDNLLAPTTRRARSYASLDTVMGAESGRQDLAVLLERLDKLDPSVAREVAQRLRLVESSLPRAAQLASICEGYVPITL